MAHVITSYVTGNFAAGGAGETTCTLSVDVGTGSNRVILFLFSRRTDRAAAVNSITVGGESMTVLGSDLTNPQDAIRPFRSAVLLNPTITGTQNIVITCVLPGGSYSDCQSIVAVYDNVNPSATPSSLLTISENELEVTPWTGSGSLDIPSETGHQAVVMSLLKSSDAGYTLTPSGFTERVNGCTGGFARISGEAAGSSVVSVSWGFSGLSANVGQGQYGWSLPPPGGYTPKRKIVFVN